MLNGERGVNGGFEKLIQRQFRLEGTPTKVKRKLAYRDLYMVRDIGTMAEEHGGEPRELYRFPVY
jgi:hypothetical protein